MLKGLRKKASILSISSQSSQQSAGSVVDGGDDVSYGKILKQVHDFEVALKAMDYLLDDRTPEGTQLLKRKLKDHESVGTEQPASIFNLALGVMEFIEATLGFEPEIMTRAHVTLSEAEASALNNSKYNTKHHLITSNIYPPGTEFQVTHAESTLLNALVMLLQENNGMVESAKALYKLRKAYHSLDGVYKKIKESEPIFTKNLNKLKAQTAKLNAMSSDGNKSVSSIDLPGLDNGTPGSSSASLPQDLKLMKDLERVFQMRKSRIEGTNIGNSIDPKKVNLFADMSANSSTAALSRSGSALFSERYCKGASPRPSVSSRFKANTPPVSVPSASAARDSSELSTSAAQASELSTSNGNEFDADEEDEVDDDDEDQFSDAYDVLDGSTETGSNIMPDLKAPAFNMEASNASILTDSSFEKNDSSNYLHVSTVDEFIHSGVQLCFGILQVVLSLIPPTIGKVLSIVGFKGERDVGLKLLWRNAITCRNIHGDLALLCLLVFYDGPVQFVDSGFHLPENSNSNVESILDISSRTVISDEELDKVLLNPDFYTPQLLHKVRHIFPHNALWVLQEGRILASQGQLEKAIATMQGFTDDPGNKIQMQQAEALLVFDRGMLYAFNHQFDEAARDFIKLVDLSSWCRSVYLFMAGSCYVAQWRMIQMGLVEVENKQALLDSYAEKAEKYINLAQTYIPGHGENAKKGGIGGGTKQLPFDKFVLRKSRQLQERRRKHPKLSFIDSIGTSPTHELMYFWNGYNRMLPEKLETSLKLLGYSGAVDSPHSANVGEVNYAPLPESEDEAVIRFFLQAVCLRSMKKVPEGLALLDSHVISKFVISDEPFKYHRLNHSPYLCPTALYEKTMFVWLLRTSKPQFNVKESAAESKSWLKKASIISDAGDYELSNRTGMRIKAASEKLDQIAEMSA